VGAQPEMPPTVKAVAGGRQKEGFPTFESLLSP
jgi:hypothetical protein